jgi:pimeloyl-ACP methyl ester carboxylesterase
MTSRVLLVHGAFHGGWCWEPLQSELRARDVGNEAVELPFTTFDADVAEVTAALDRMSGAGPVVLVGHSFGGAVITAAALSTGRVKPYHMVYLAALMQDPGDPIDLGETAGMAAIRVEAAGVSIDPALATTAFYHRCSPEEAARATRRLRPMPMASLTLGPSAAIDWGSVPTTYVVCTDDQIISPERQRQMAQLAGTTVDLDSDHSPFLSCPGALADILAGLATDT